MARDFAQVYQSIWSDPDFRRRTGDEQLLYLKLLSWPTLNYAGVLPLQPRKWATATTGTTAQDVSTTLDRLDAARYALVDWDTEEVLLRTFIRGDRLYRNPPMLRSALRLALQVDSSRLRVALREELALIRGLVTPALVDDVQGAIDTLSHGVPDGADHPVPDGVAHPVLTPSEHPVSHGAEHGVPDGAGVGAGVVVGPVETSEGDVPEADAGARKLVSTVVDHTGIAHTWSDGSAVHLGDRNAEPPAVPDTATSPLDDHTEPRRSAPGPAVHENAMPPRRCRNHLEKPDDWAEKCGRCKDARLAQEAWIAERDAKVARARAEAQAEIAAQREAGRVAIARCTYCDDRGITPGGVLCTHDDRAHMAPGRAAFAAAKDQLAHRAESRSRTRPATGEQLQALAVAFGRHGNNDRAERIRWCNTNLPADRQITSTTQLTRAEASSLIDTLTALEPSVDDADAVASAESFHRSQAPDQREEPPVEDPVDDDPSLNVDLSDPDAVDAAAPVHERGVCPDCADGDHCRSCDCCDEPHDADPAPDGDGTDGSWTADEDDVAYSYAGGSDEPPF